MFTGPRRNIFEVEPTLHPDICGLDETVFHRAHTLHAHPRSKLNYDQQVSFQKKAHSSHPFLKKYYLVHF